MPSSKDAVDAAITALSKAELRLFVMQIAEILYWDYDENRWYADKEWGGDTLEAIGHYFPKRFRAAVVKESNAQAK